LNKFLPFKQEEYDLRIKKLRALMKQEGFDALLLCRQENVHYLTGFNTTGYWSFQALIVPIEGELRFVVRHFEALNADAYSWLPGYRSYKDDEDGLGVLCEELSKMGLSKSRVAMEKANGFFFGIGNYERLRSMLPDMKVSDCSALLERIRSIKTDSELLYIRKAASIVSRAMKDGIAAVSEGVPEAQIAAEVYRSLLLNGSAFLANPPFVSSGWKTGLGHSTWGDKRVEKGDNVYFELVACVNRYHVPLMRTVSVGQPSALSRKIAETSLAAVEAAMGVIRAGATAEEVDAAARGEIARRGMSECFRHRTGYSVGVAYPPGWPEGGLLSLRPGNKEELEANMVLHLPLVLLGNGETGAGFSETVLVTKTGCEPLTSCARDYLQK